MDRLRHVIRDRVHAFIESDGRSEPFEALALDVFADQYERIPLYRRFCDARDVSPANVGQLDRIPYLPADAFKEQLDPEADRPHVFHSSGTTAGPERRSRHALASLDTYRLSATGHFARKVLADRPGALAVLVLGPTVQSYPHSSLGQMFSWCIEQASGARDDSRSLVAFDPAGRVDVEAAITWLAERAEGSQPVLVLAVTAALSALLDALRDRERSLRLPADSRIVDTGGKKGGAPGQRVLSARGVLKACWRFLHVPAYLCVNEYGMTEMLSQFYDDTLSARHGGRMTPRAKVGPPWVRTQIVDPQSLLPVAPGQRGILRHFDLANWETVSALQTLDVGRDHGDGFELLGRATAAEERGCSQLFTAMADRGAPAGGR